MSGLPCWVDGRVVPRAEAHPRIDDSALIGGVGHYTTARVRAGVVLWVDRHVERLRVDARRLGMPRVDELAVRAAFAELAPAAFGTGDGAIRLQHTRDSGGHPHWLGVPRGLGRHLPTWRAVRAPFVHEGPRPWSGIKTTNTLLYALAQSAATARDAQDALFADSAGRLIEGTRSNLFVVLASGECVTPDLRRGGVAGLARELLLERSSDFAVRDVSFHALASAREIIAVNSLRGARPIVELDGAAVGAAAGPAAARLDALLDIQ